MGVSLMQLVADLNMKQPKFSFNAIAVDMTLWACVTEVTNAEEDIIAAKKKESK
jgi:hypothetical protein